MGHRETFRRIDAETIKSLNKDDLEITTGLTVGDLRTDTECSNAIHLIQGQIDSITTQIAMQAEGLIDKGAVWRNSAQNAIRWKKRVISAISERRAAITPAKPNRRSGVFAKAILDVIREDIGDERMQQYVAKARRDNPHLFEDEV